MNIFSKSTEKKYKVRKVVDQQYYADNYLFAGLFTLHGSHSCENTMGGEYFFVEV